MKYYTVKKDIGSQWTYCHKDNTSRLYTGNLLVWEALYTPAERNKLFPEVKDEVFDIVEVPQNKIHFTWSKKRRADRYGDDRYADEDANVKLVSSPDLKMITSSVLGFPWYRLGHWGVVLNVPLWGTKYKAPISTYNNMFMYICPNSPVISTHWVLYSPQHDELTGKINIQDAIKILTSPEKRISYSIADYAGGFWHTLPYKLRTRFGKNY